MDMFVPIIPQEYLPHLSTINRIELHKNSSKILEIMSHFHTTNPKIQKNVPNFHTVKSRKFQEEKRDMISNMFFLQQMIMGHQTLALRCQEQFLFIFFIILSKGKLGFCWWYSRKVGYPAARARRVKLKPKPVKSVSVYLQKSVAVFAVPGSWNSTLEHADISGG